MKNYGKKVLSVLLALLMCLTVVALDFSGLTAGAYTASPTHTYQIRVSRVSRSGNYDGQDGGGTCTVYGKDKNGTGSQVTLWNNYDLGSGFVDGGETSTSTRTDGYWPTQVYVSANVDNNNNMFYNPQGADFRIDLYVRDENSGTYNRYEFATFSWSSSTVSGGGGTSGKNSGWKNCPSGLYPHAAKVATSKSEGNAVNTNASNITLNATGGASKTLSLSAYVYDQYNAIWTSAPKSWSVSGTVGGDASLSSTGAVESNTLTVTATNYTRAKANLTVKASYDSLYHQWTIPITPTYKITYNVSGNGGTSAVPGPDNTANNNTGSANVSYTIPNSTNYTAKKETSSTGTWTFVGWNGSQSATTGSKAGASITIDNYNDTLYAIFSKTATATFYWYNSSGQRTSSENTKTVYNNATQYTFDVPKSSVPATFTVSGTT
jgi:hypothetical protein